MNRTLALTRFGAPGLAFVLVASSPVLGRAQSRYEVQGSFQSTRDMHTSADGRTLLLGTLTPAIQRQAGETYTLLGHVDAPLVCASDEIFSNGFEL